MCFCFGLLCFHRTVSRSWMWENLYFLSLKKNSTHGCWNWNPNTLTTWYKELTHLKRLWCWKRLRAGGEGNYRGWDARWHHWLNGHGFGWTPGVGDGQGGLACYGSWGRKESDTTEQLNWTELMVQWDSIKNSPASAGEVGSIPESGRSLGKEMATHSSILAWEIPWTEEHGGLQSMGSQKSQTQLSN